MCSACSACVYDKASGFDPSSSPFALVPPPPPISFFFGQSRQLRRRPVFFWRKLACARKQEERLGATYLQFAPRRHCDRPGRARRFGGWLGEGGERGAEPSVASKMRNRGRGEGDSSGDGGSSLAGSKLQSVGRVLALLALPDGWRRAEISRAASESFARGEKWRSVGDAERAFSKSRRANLGQVQGQRRR